MSRDIAESCTSISLAMLSWRLHSILGESRIYDHLEKVLYNHLLGAVPLNHLGTFYYNPLKMLGLPDGKTDHGGPLTCHTMLPAVHSTSCCIPNEWRFFAALGEYVYSYDKEGIFINLYSSGSMRISLPSGIEAALNVETLYPHNGRILITFQNEKPAAFTVRLRIPGWCSSGKLKVPGRKKISVKGGSYAAVHYTWKKGDKIHLELEMPVRMLLPDPREKENEGQAVLARGPLIYCLEQADLSLPIANAEWDFYPEEAEKVVKVIWKSEMLGGINHLLAPGTVEKHSLILPLIPYYARANRMDKNLWMTFLPLKKE